VLRGAAVVAQSTSLVVRVLVRILEPPHLDVGQETSRAGVLAPAALIARDIGIGARVRRQDQLRDLAQLLLQPRLAEAGRLMHEQMTPAGEHERIVVLMRVGAHRRIAEHASGDRVGGNIVRRGMRIGGHGRPQVARALPSGDPMEIRSRSHAC
jgi:hypothetical protein